MTPEAMRMTILADIDALMSRPFVWVAMSDEQRRLVRAQRAYWESADVVTLQRLLDLLALQP